MIKMLQISFIYSVFIFCKLINVNQAELSIVMTDIDAYADPYFVEPGFEVFLLDEGIDNQVFINFTVLHFPPNDTTSHFKMIGATMGEYLISTGFEYTSPMCELFNEPIILGRLAKSVGFTDCPGELGNYGNEAYMIDLETLPDEFPPNKYLLHVWLDSVEAGIEIGSFTVYFTIQ